MSGMDEGDIVQEDWKRRPGHETVALYCDECGQLYCDRCDDDEPED